MTKMQAAQPYTLVPEQRAVVRALAKASHDACNGTGIVSWEAGGKVANLCTCVMRHGDDLQSSLESLQARLMSNLAILKGEQS